MVIGTPTAPVAMASAAAGTATTGSFTPAANVALFAFGTARKLSATIVTPVITDSLGLTWTPIGNVNYDPGSNPRLAAQLYVAFPGASPSAMTVTSTSTGASQTAVNVVSVTGASVTAGDYTNAIVSAVNSAGDPTATLGSSPGATSGVLGFTFMNATNLITPPSGFTQIEENTAATAFRVETSYDITTPGAGAHTWASTNTVSFGFLVEVKEPSAGSYSMIASPGTFTLTGTAAGLQAARKMVAASASFTLTGANVNLAKGYRLTALAGSFVLTGAAVALRASRRMVAASASFALTGQAAGLRAGRKLTSGAGSFVLTGIDVSFTYTPGGVDYTMAAGSGSFALAGSAVAFKRAARMAAAPATYSLVGSDVTLTFGVALSNEITSGDWTSTRRITRTITAGPRSQGLTIVSGNWDKELTA